ncbi:MAG: cytochrome c3 family protein [Acidobacteriota bacterium]
MKKNTIVFIVAVFLAVGFVVITGDLTATKSQAQQTEDPKMPEVVILGKDAKLGQVTFNHLKHNGGAYNITPGATIACISCHHTARPAAEIAKFPPLKTSWPADRTTILTAELFAKDPKGAGVAACRDCHARTDQKPKLLDKIPEIKHEASTALMTMTNMQAFHRTCAGCHGEVRKTNALSKGPIQTQCMMCHKKAA